MVSINPKELNCTCGYRFVPSLFEKIIMLVFGEYVKRCPQCGCRMNLKLISHVVCVDRKCIKNREIVWWRG